MDILSKIQIQLESTQTENSELKRLIKKASKVFSPAEVDRLKMTYQENRKRIYELEIAILVLREFQE